MSMINGHWSLIIDIGHSAAWLDARLTGVTHVRCVNDRHRRCYRAGTLLLSLCAVVPPRPHRLCWGWNETGALPGSGGAGARCAEVAFSVQQAVQRRASIHQHSSRDPRCSGRAGPKRERQHHIASRTTRRWNLSGTTTSRSGRVATFELRVDKRARLHLVAGARDMGVMSVSFNVCAPAEPQAPIDRVPAWVAS